MQFFKSDSEETGRERDYFAKRLAFLFCILASGIGWAVIIGLVLLLKPEFLP